MIALVLFECATWQTGLRYANAASYGLVKRLTEPYVQVRYCGTRQLAA